VLAQAGRSAPGAPPDRRSMRGMVLPDPVRHDRLRRCDRDVPRESCAASPRMRGAMTPAHGRSGQCAFTCVADLLLPAEATDFLRSRETEVAPGYFSANDDWRKGCKSFSVASMGARLGRYVMLKHLASGGMADVMLGRSDGIEGFERHVVLKRIRP